MLQARRDGVDGVVRSAAVRAPTWPRRSCFFTEQERARPGASFADRPALPHVAIPTTYSGAELTPVLRHDRPAHPPEERRRRADVAPIAAVYDPELTLSTPARVSAETGMNALAHCVEAVWSPAAHAGGRGHRPGRRPARSSTRCRAWWTTRATSTPAPTCWRAPRWPAGRCQNASMGVHHGLSQLSAAAPASPTGSPTPIVLPARHALQRAGGARGHRRDRRALGGGDPAAAVAALGERLGLPTRLRDFGVTDDDLDAVARLSQGNPNVAGNPRPVSEDDARAILDAAY